MRLLAISITAIHCVLALAACDRGPRSGPTANPPRNTEARLYVVENPTKALAVGEPNAVRLAVRPAAGWKINKLFDWRFEFHPTDDAVMETTQVASDAIELDDARASIPVTITPRTAGAVEVPATGSFSVCNDEKCELFEGVEVTFAINGSASQP